jgi:hypothetical protein
MAALLGGVSFSGLATGTSLPKAVKSATDKSTGSAIDSHVSSKTVTAVLQYDCEVKTLGCDKSGWVCGETAEDREFQAWIDELIYCP